MKVSDGDPTVGTRTAKGYRLTCMSLHKYVNQGVAARSSCHFLHMPIGESGLQELRWRENEICKHHVSSSGNFSCIRRMINRVQLMILGFCEADAPSSMK